MSTFGLNMIPEVDYWTTIVDEELVHNWNIDGKHLVIPNSNGVPSIGEDAHCQMGNGWLVWRINNLLFAVEPLNPKP